MGFYGFKSTSPSKTQPARCFWTSLGVLLVALVLWCAIASAVFWMKHPDTRKGDINPIDVLTFGYTADE